MAGKAMDPLGLLSDDSDASDDEEEATKQAEEAANAAKKRKKVDFETLCAAGYKGGPSVLLVPETTKGQQSWDWAQKDPNKVQREATAETAEDRAATRAALEGLDSAVEQAILHKAKLEAVREEERAQKKHLSFNQKEKRKRDAGQATSSKNFVEEEKRLLREAGGN